VSLLRHNILALGVDYGLFMVGLSFASQATLLPAFAAWLGAPNVVIGAIPAVMTLGWFLPSLFAAGHTEGLARKLPFLLKWTVWERVPFPAMALLAFLLADRAPDLTLALLLGLLFVMTGVGGMLMPAWMDLVGRAIPTAMRGRFFALSSLAAGLVGFGASLVVTHVLATVPAPASYGLCFVAASVCMVASFVALTLVREPPGAAAPPAIGMRAHLARVPRLLRENRNLSRFLAARALGVTGAMATGFYTVYALHAWDAPVAQAGVFTALLILGQAIGTLTLGWTADRAGHRVVLITGMAATAAANVVALLASTLGGFDLVFVLIGVQQAAVNISNLNVLLEFAPTPAERPTYVGLGSTSMAPVAFATPLIAGLMADAMGFRAVFLAALAGGLGGLVMLSALVRDPRHVVTTPRAGEAGA
jgi:MFS family permease